jgi:hypothetical protein
MTLRKFVFPFVFLCAGCSTGDAGPAFRGSTTDSAGVTIVSNANEGIWSDANRWTVEQDLVIGAVDGDPNYLFGNITGICVGTDRRIYVLDQAATIKIRVYSPEGVFLNAFAQVGSGPGEMGDRVGPCLMAPGDTLLIPDMGNLRVNKYGSDGSSVGNVLLDLRMGFPLGWDVDTDSRILQLLRPLGNRDPAANGVDLVVALGNDGVVTDTLVELPSGRTNVRIAPRASTIRFFALEPSWGTTTDGRILHGTNDRYRIGITDGSGNLVRVITKAYEPQAITETDRAVITNLLAEGWRSSGLQAALIEQELNTLQFAEFYPAYHRLLSGPRGSIWAQKVTGLDSLSAQDRNILGDVRALPGLIRNPLLLFGARHWEVFDANGGFLGEVTMPARFTAMKLVGEAVYGVWRDELEVEHLMRLGVVIPE